MQKSHGFSLLEVLIAGFIATLVILTVRLTLTRELVQLEFICYQITGNHCDQQ